MEWKKTGEGFIMGCRTSMTACLCVGGGGVAGKKGGKKVLIVFYFLS